MSKLEISKAASVLIGLSILATGTIFAQNDIPNAALKRPGIGPVPAAVNKQLTSQRITGADIENKLATMREKIASKEAILKARLQNFKDQKKATAAARISINLNRINQNHTTQMQRFLDLMSAILDKLEARVNQPTPDIKNPDAAKTAIAETRTVIATASAAVANQAQQDYTIQVTTEGRIRADAQAMRNKLHTDILALRKIVVDAKQAVAHAIRIAKSGASATPGAQLKEGTTSGQQ